MFCRPLLVHRLHFVPRTDDQGRRTNHQGRFYSPYGTQMFFTWVACWRYQRPSACLGSNQSMARPSFVNTCFRFPTEYAFAAAALASSPKHQTASTSSCSARVFSNCEVYPVTMFTAPPGKSLVSKTW